MFSSLFGSTSAPVEGAAASEAEAAGDDAAQPAKRDTALGSLFSSVQSLGSSLRQGVDKVASVSLLKDFSAEQERFARKTGVGALGRGAAVPPWVGAADEEGLRERILQLSADERNFIRDPPAGVQFAFDFEADSPVANAILREDPRLQEMRFRLVPKKAKEQQFWRNYFYRVSLVKQSSQLSAMTPVAAARPAHEAPPAAADPAQADRRASAGGSSSGPEDRGEDIASTDAAAAEVAEDPLVEGEEAADAFFVEGEEAADAYFVEDDGVGGGGGVAAEDVSLDELGGHVPAAPAAQDAGDAMAALGLDAGLDLALEEDLDGLLADMEGGEADGGGGGSADLAELEAELDAELAAMEEDA